MIAYREEANGILSLSFYKSSACESMLAHVRGLDDWESATIRVHPDEDVYQSVPAPDVRAASILSACHLKQIFSDFDHKMSEIIKPVIKEFWGVRLEEYDGTQLVRYIPGGRYLAHRDTGLDLENRYFTVLCYLNDDFEGGTTAFPHIGYRAVPETGKVLLFPSGYLHAAEPVLKGEKYVLVSWVLGPLPIRWI
jgi:hypothetical protein